MDSVVYLFTMQELGLSFRSCIVFTACTLGAPDAACVGLFARGGCSAILKVIAAKQRELSCHHRHRHVDS